MKKSTTKMKSNASELFEEFSGKQVLFVSTKNRDYIRNTQEIELLKQTAGKVTVVASYRSGYILRLLYVYGWLLCHSCREFDVVFVGFAPQLILLFWKRKFKKSILVIDFFISIYDTMVFDRKKFRSESLPGRISKRIDRKTLEKADWILADTAAHATYFSNEFGVQEDKIRVFYLSADQTIYYPREVCKPETYRDKFLILYFGSILPLQGVDIILDTIIRMQNVAEVYFEIIGPVGNMAQQTENATFIPWLPQEELAKHIAYADLCLAGHFNKEIDKAKRTIPGKAFIYEAMGKRMVLGDNSANRELFSEDDNHFFVRMGDAGALEDTIMKLLPSGGSRKKTVQVSEIDISFIVPIYNNEEYIEQCIQSLCRQSGNIEIILIDDGSTDRSYQLCKGYADQDERIILCHQENMGANVARNKGLEIARGNWVYFADGDDWIERDVMDSLSGFMNDDCDLILFSHYIAANGTMKRANHAGKNLWFQMDDFTSLQIVTLNRLGNYPYNFRELDAVSLWNKLYRRSFLKQNRIQFIPELAKLQDLTFNLMVYDCAKKAVYVDVPIYTYRINENSVSRRYQPDLTDKFCTVHDFLIPFVEKKQDERLKKALWERVATHSRTNVVLNFCNNQNRAGYRERRDAFCEVMQTEPYRSMKKEVDVRNFTPQEAILSMAVNHNLFWLCELLSRANVFREHVRRQDRGDDFFAGLRSESKESVAKPGKTDSQKFKVLFISTEDSKYGAPKSMLALMKLLQTDYNVEVMLLTTKHNALNAYCDEHGIKTYSCYYADIMSGSVYEGKAKNMAKHIVKYGMYLRSCLMRSRADRISIPFDEIDLIHSNSNRVDIGAYFSEKYHIPHIWHLREMDEGTKGMVYYKRNWASYMNQHASEFIAITEVVKSSWIKKGLEEKKIKVIYNGIDMSQREEKIERCDSQLKIVVVGRIEKSKGQEDLIRAVCMLPMEMQKNISIDFMGESYADYEKKLVKIMRRENCEACINFLGYCEHVSSRLKYYDVGMTCSPAEAFGRTTVEYMMTGLLTIATDTGANPELITDGVSGLLYRQGDFIHLSEILADVYEHKYDVKQIGRAGMERAMKLFTAEENARKIYREYMSVSGKQQVS